MKTGEMVAIIAGLATVAGVAYEILTPNSLLNQALQNSGQNTTTAASTQPGYTSTGTGSPYITYPQSGSNLWDPIMQEYGTALQSLQNEINALQTQQTTTPTVTSPTPGVTSSPTYTPSTPLPTNTASTFSVAAAQAAGYTVGTTQTAAGPIQTLSIGGNTYDVNGNLLYSSAQASAVAAGAKVTQTATGANYNYAPGTPQYAALHPAVSEAPGQTTAIMTPSGAVSITNPTGTKQTAQVVGIGSVSGNTLNIGSSSGSKTTTLIQLPSSQPVIGSVMANYPNTTVTNQSILHYNPQGYSSGPGGAGFTPVVSSIGSLSGKGTGVTAAQTANFVKQTLPTSTTSNWVSNTENTIGNAYKSVSSWLGKL